MHREKATIMMGSKERHFAPLMHVSLKELVPQDHFYRHLERSLDLSFVYAFAKETYAGKGRPSIDPVVFFKCHLTREMRGRTALEADCPFTAVNGRMPFNSRLTR